MSEIRVSDTPIFEELVKELAARGIAYEGLLAPKFTPTQKIPPASPNVAETPTMALQTVPKPLWVIDDEE